MNLLSMTCSYQPLECRFCLIKKKQIPRSQKHPERKNHAPRSGWQLGGLSPLRRTAGAQKTRFARPACSRQAAAGKLVGM